MTVQGGNLLEAELYFPENSYAEVLTPRTSV